MNKRNVPGAVVIVIGVCLFAYGCSSGSSSDSSGGSSSLRVLARNVIFGPSSASAATKMRAAGAVDTTTQVLAENVVIENANNSLTSADLQSALDNELAIKLSSYLPGTVWTVANKTADPNFSGSTGQLTFSAGTFTINSGRLAVAGVGDISCTINPVGSLSYELLSDGVMYLTWAAQDGSQQDATVTVVARSKDQLVLVGTGGCGFQGIPRISVLKKAP